MPWMFVREVLGLLNVWAGLPLQPAKILDAWNLQKKKNRFFFRPSRLDASSGT